jgi:SAM-dependent methyltransferase
MPVWILIFLAVAGLLFVVKVLYVLAAGWTLPKTRGALFVSTASARIRSFLDAVPMKPGDRFVDLGCGDGRVLRAASRRYSVRAIGYEVNPLAYGTARLLSLGMSGVRVRWGNFWEKDLADADVVFCYLFPDVMKRLSTKLRQELGPGTRVISCNFSLPGWHPEKILHPDSLRHGDPIYVYQLPFAPKAG